MMGKMQNVLKFMSIVLLFVGCTVTNKYGPYYGKVIDAETKKPIEGAAVLAVFSTEEYGPAGAITRFADATETITDKNGEFKIPTYRVIAVRPVQGWNPMNPQFRIFRPGYGCYPMHKDVRPMFVPNGTLPANQYVIIELPKIKTEKERIESTMCSPSSDIPTEKAKKLIDLINQERKYLGYNPIRQ